MTRRQPLFQGSNTIRQLIASSVIATGLVWAPASGAFDVTLSQTYLLGDKDTLSMARETLHQRLLDEAARQAGTYVTREERLRDGELTESIEVVTAAMIRADTVDEVVNTTGGQPELTLTVAFHVDDSELDQRVAALYNDQAKRREIERLSRHNQQLRDRLRSLSLDKALNPVGTDTSLAETRRLLTQLKDNQQTINRVFGSENLSAQLAQASSNYRSHSWDMTINAQKLANQLNDQLRSQLVHVTRIGDTYQVQILVSGLNNLAELTQEHLGLQLPSNGIIDNGLLSQWNNAQREQFFHAFRLLGYAPVFLRAVIGQEHTDPDHPKVASQILLGPARLRSGINGPRIAGTRPMERDMAQWLVEQNQLQHQLGLASYQGVQTSKDVTFKENGDVLFTMSLPVSLGDITSMDIGVFQAPWDMAPNRNPQGWEGTRVSSAD